MSHAGLNDLEYASLVVDTKKEKKKNLFKVRLPLRAYLCGGIQGLSDAECNDWRDYMIDNLTFSNGTHRFEFMNPMKRDYRKYDKSLTGRGDEFTRDIEKQIVEYDKIDISSSQVLFYRYVKPSSGSSMELLLAHQWGKLNIVMADPDVLVSPWIHYHAQKVFSYTGVETFQQATEFAWNYFYGNAT